MDRILSGCIQTTKCSAASRPDPASVELPEGKAIYIRALHPDNTLSPFGNTTAPQPVDIIMKLRFENRSHHLGFSTPAWSLRHSLLCKYILFNTASLWQSLFYYYLFYIRTTIRYRICYEIVMHAWWNARPMQLYIISSFSCQPVWLKLFKPIGYNTKLRDWISQQTPKLIVCFYIWPV